MDDDSVCLDMQTVKRGISSLRIARWGGMEWCGVGEGDMLVVSSAGFALWVWAPVSSSVGVLPISVRVCLFRWGALLSVHSSHCAAARQSANVQDSWGDMEWQIIPVTASPTGSLPCPNDPPTHPLATPCLASPGLTLPRCLVASNV